MPPMPRSFSRRVSIIPSAAAARPGSAFWKGRQLVTGDTTVLQPGMVLAIDGSVSAEGFRAQVGDSFILTEDGYEQITHHPKATGDMVL